MKDYYNENTETLKIFNIFKGIFKEICNDSFRIEQFAEVIKQFFDVILQYD